MEFHEAANIFPLAEELLDGLAADIKANGQKHAIQTLGGKILDGRRRWLACQKIGVKPKIKAIEVADPISHALSENLHRRHLSPTQLAMVGARARQIYDRQAKERQREGQERGREKQKGFVENFPQTLFADGGSARDQAGSAVGVSGKLIDMATKVLSKGAPELVAAVDADQIAVSTAARASTLPEEEQKALVQRNAAKGKGKRKRPKEQAEAEGEPGGGDKMSAAEQKQREKALSLSDSSIASLREIQPENPFRRMAFQRVLNWVKCNIKRLKHDGKIS